MLLAVFNSFRSPLPKHRCLMSDVTLLHSTTSLLWNPRCLRKHDWSQAPPRLFSLARWLLGACATGHCESVLLLRKTIGRENRLVARQSFQCRSRSCGSRAVCCHPHCAKLHVLFLPVFVSIHMVLQHAHSVHLFYWASYWDSAWHSVCYGNLREKAFT